MPNVMQFFLTSNVDCSDICCFTQNRYLFKYLWLIFASLFQMSPHGTELHSSIDLCSLSLSRFCTSASLEHKDDAGCYFHVKLAPIISQCWWCKRAITRIAMMMMTMMMMTMMMMTLIMMTIMMTTTIWRDSSSTWWPLPVSSQQQGHCYQSTEGSPCAHSTPGVIYISFFFVQMYFLFSFSTIV